MIKFDLGSIVATPAALDALKNTTYGIMPQQLIDRHANGDWGDLHDEDRGLNEDALRTGARLFSVYNLPSSNGSVVTFWVITDAEDEDGVRLSTTILLPEDY